MIGELRHPITIKRATVVSDGYGGQTVSGYSTTKVFAQVKTANGNESISDGAVQNVQSRTLIIRKQDVLTSDVVYMDGTDWIISDIEELNDKPFYLSLSIHRKQVTGG